MSRRKQAIRMFEATSIVAPFLNREETRRRYALPRARNSVGSPLYLAADDCYAKSKLRAIWHQEPKE